jgi:hypothetical protein
MIETATANALISQASCNPLEGDILVKSNSHRHPKVIHGLNTLPMIMLILCSPSGHRPGDEASDSLQRIQEGQCLYGFSIEPKTHCRRPPARYGYTEQRIDNDRIPLRQSDINRWRLASNAIERHLWYTTCADGDNIVSVEYLNVDFADVYLPEIRPRDFIGRWSVLPLEADD